MCDNKIVGIFDLMRTSGSLGNLLIFIEELAIKCREYGSNIVNADIIILRDAKQIISDDFDVNIDNKINTNIIQCVSNAIEQVSMCHDATNQRFDDIQKLLSENIIWPDPDSIVSCRHNYDSTQRIQSYYKRVGSIPRLRVKPALLTRARHYIENKSAGALPIAVHLKQNPNIIGQSNANLGAWYNFFKEISNRYSVHFFLVGDEESNSNFNDLTNTSVVYSDGFSIDGQLAIIQACELFMGMMSGPSNMALFGSNPYLIFKNPDHHFTEMKSEIGDNDQYPFGIGHQKVLRILDTADSLTHAFEMAVQHIS